MLENYFIKGILIGLIFGIPAGVIGALTIKRTLSHGAFAGLASGLGCSAADLLYSCVSIFGLTLVSDFLLKYQNIISIAGGVLIIISGLGIILKKQESVSENTDASRIVSFFASSFIIAITN
ncbi:MAG: LysE family transporter, partial [Oscillospiraceae bacterium]|nr:LysE family transporter [Oscillospiraceae bacterium]